MLYLMVHNLICTKSLHQIVTKVMADGEKGGVSGIGRETYIVMI